MKDFFLCMRELITSTDIPTKDETGRKIPKVEARDIKKKCRKQEARKTNAKKKTLHSNIKHCVF